MSRSLRPWRNGWRAAREFELERNVMTISGNYTVGNRAASFVRVLHRL